MGRSARLVAGVVAGFMLSTIVMAPAASAGAASKRRKGTLDNPCTLLSTQEVKKQFGGPIAVPVLDKTYLSCRYSVGVDPAQAGGVLDAVQLFPNYLEPTTIAKNAFEDEHAIDAISNQVLIDVNGVGRNAYMNLTKGTVVVLATKRFMFTLTWHPIPVHPLNQRDIKKLTTLAKLIVPRSPR